MAVRTYPMAMVTEPEKVEFRERSLPQVGAHDVVVKVRAASICGSDVHIFKGKHPAAPLPVAVGHEIAGEVIQIGDAVTRVREGERVAVEPVVACGECYFCRRGEYHLCVNISFQYRQGQGGFSPYFVVNEHWAHVLPENISYEEGALIEPLAVAVHAVKKSGLAFGHSAAIFGAGSIGLLILMVARHAGASQTFVVDVQEHRLKRARELGATRTIDNTSEDAVQVVMQNTSELGVARAFEAVGIQITLVQALQSLRKGGRAVLVGLFEEPEVGLPANIFVQREITLSGSQGYNWDFQTALELVANGDVKLDGLITHVLPLEALQEGFDTLLDPENGAVKVVMKVDSNVKGVKR